MRVPREPKGEDLGYMYYYYLELRCSGLDRRSQLMDFCQRYFMRIPIYARICAPSMHDVLLFPFIYLRPVWKWTGIISFSFLKG
jgi:hypothetical protein